MNWEKALEVTKGTNKITCPNCLYSGCSNWGKSTYTKGVKHQRYKCRGCGEVFTFGVKKIFFDKGFEHAIQKVLDEIGKDISEASAKLKTTPNFADLTKANLSGMMLALEVLKQKLKQLQNR